MHAAAQLLARLLELRALVIRSDARSGISVEGQASEARRVAVHRPVAGGLDLGKHLGHAEEDAGEVHHLGEPDHARVLEERRQVGCLERRAGRLHVGRRHA